MAVREFCDMCGAEMPVQGQLQSLTIGEQKIADACVNCRQKLVAAVNAAKLEAAKPKMAPAEVTKEEFVEEAVKHGQATGSEPILKA